jgi:hypothetical protein
MSLDAVCECTRVEGDLTIDAVAVTDIRCLRSLREVTGKLAITAPMGSSMLTNLSGLEQLNEVGSLILSDLPVTDLAVFANLRRAKSVVLTNLTALATLDGLHCEVDHFELTQANSLTDLSGLRATIREFWLQKNAKLRSLDGFIGLPGASGDAPGPNIRIEGDPELESLDGLFQSEHARVARFQLLGLPKLETLDLRDASELAALVVRSCTVLHEIRGLDSIETLEQLHLTGLTKLSSLPSLMKLRSIVDLELIELPLLKDLQQLSPLTSVDRISLTYLDSLKSLHGLENVTRGQRFLFEDLIGLESLEGLRGLEKIDTLWIAGDDKLKSLRGLNLQSARELAVRYNDLLQTLEGLEKLADVGTIDFSENPALITVRALGSLQAAEKVFARANGRLAQCELDWLVRRLPTSTHEFSENGPAGTCGSD